MQKIGWLVVVMLVGLGLSGCCCLKQPCKGAPMGGAAKEGQSLCPTCGGSGDRCQCASGQKQTAEINTTVLKTLIESGVPLTVLDARTGKYDDGRRIPGAQGLGADSKDEEIIAKLKSKDALIVTYCANLQCPASRTLAAKLRALGYMRVLEYPYGIDGWVAAGNSVVPSGK